MTHSVCSKAGWRMHCMAYSSPPSLSLFAAHSSLRLPFLRRSSFSSCIFAMHKSLDLIWPTHLTALQLFYRTNSVCFRIRQAWATVVVRFPAEQIDLPLAMFRHHVMQYGAYVLLLCASKANICTTTHILYITVEHICKRSQSEWWRWRRGNPWNFEKNRCHRCTLVRFRGIFTTTTTYKAKSDVDNVRAARVSLSHKPNAGTRIPTCWVKENSLIATTINMKNDITVT